MSTPFFMRKDVMQDVAQLSQFDDELYKVNSFTAPFKKKNLINNLRAIIFIDICYAFIKSNFNSNNLIAPDSKLSTILNVIARIRI